MNHTDDAAVQKGDRQRVPPLTAAAKIAAFVLPVSIISALFRNHHPDIGSAIGINVGAVLMFFVPPRRTSLPASLLIGVLLSALYLVIIYI